MANPKLSFSDNVPGPWYVDKECICCDLCGNIAPDIFRPTDDYDHNMVHRQPNTVAELAEAKDAMESCPVEAIGNDRASDIGSESGVADISLTIYQAGGIAI